MRVLSVYSLDQSAFCKPLRLVLYTKEAKTTSISVHLSVTLADIFLYAFHRKMAGLF